VDSQRGSTSKGLRSTGIAPPCVSTTASAGNAYSSIRSKPASRASPDAINGLTRSSAAAAAAPTTIPAIAIQMYFIARLARTCASPGRVGHGAELDGAFDVAGLADARHGPRLAVAALEQRELAAAADDKPALLAP